MDRLAMNAMLAMKAGMSYGKWKALQPAVVPERKELPDGVKICPYCGKEFRGRKNKKYCNPECTAQYNNLRRRVTNKEYMRQYRKRGRL